MKNRTDIIEVFAWEALDSRGTPTVACEVGLTGGTRGTAMVPSGASVGTHEAKALRDGGQRYGGDGVRTATAQVNSVLATAVRGLDATAQADVDTALRAADGTADLSVVGANAVLAVSVATARAAADAAGEPLYRYVAEGSAAPLLPMPMVNIISGGAHAGRAVDIQDFLVVPIGAGSFAEAIETAWEVRRSTAAVVASRGHNVALIADEGGLGPVLPSNRAALELLAAGIEKAGFRLGTDAAIAIDVAASEFYDPAGRTYDLAAEQRALTAVELTEELRSWAADFPIVSIEDPLAEDDWEHWPGAAAALAGMQVLGDDLFVTDPKRLRRGIACSAANAVLVKPNQIGTLTAAHEVVNLAHGAAMATVLSARSGETEDSWLADLAVGWRTGQIKVGSTMRSERTAKWNRLLEIEARLGSAATFAGAAALAPAPAV
ncbi:phosphopyruvate hydratase [Streptomyces sp. NBC_01549]|uniref:phosphopyruvate hydratase n=1 Tax=Streptomyces sp. NBC_01549 TaxID=2975874 RepID=UPI0022552379|nr:phosphopyruvate hydratase [Streptomyces sp. NBC_01549]MCX4596734.1 phosphopyruvate hydratase [Streptomyces sp. NBC_01549]